METWLPVPPGQAVENSIKLATLAGQDLWLCWPCELWSPTCSCCRRLSMAVCTACSAGCRLVGELVRVGDICWCGDTDRGGLLSRACASLTSMLLLQANSGHIASEWATFGSQRAKQKRRERECGHGLTGPSRQGPAKTRVPTGLLHPGKAPGKAVPP